MSLENPLELEDHGQINVSPSRPGALWKVITHGIRCPRCQSQASKAETGKRTNAAGFSEHYRRCPDCNLRFRVVYE